MRTLESRIAVLECAVNNKPMQVMDVDAVPTPAQLAEIDRIVQTGRRLIVFDHYLNWAWMPASGMLPPWEA